MGDRSKKTIRRIHKNSETIRHQKKRQTPGRPRKCLVKDDSSKMQIQSIKHLSDIKNLIPSQWNFYHGDNEAKFVRITGTDVSGQTVKVTHCIIMSAELSWKVYVHDQEVCKEKCSVLSGISSNLKNEDDVRKLVNLVSTCNVCAGHPDDHLVEMLKAKHGKVHSKNGDTLARLDSSSSVCLNGKTYMRTVRSSSCQVLSRGKKCPSCVSYRAQLRAMYHRWKKIKCLSPSKRASTSSRTPFTHLRTPERQKRYSLLRVRTVSAERKLKRLRQRLDESINHSGVTVQLCC